MDFKFDLKYPYCPYSYLYYYGVEGNKKGLLYSRVDKNAEGEFPHFLMCRVTPKYYTGCFPI